MAKLIIKGTPWYIHASMLASIVLVIASFCIPPYAVIDSSVIAVIGELIGGATLITFVLNIPAYIEAGAKAKITHGNTTIEVSGDDDDDDDVCVNETSEE